MGFDLANADAVAGAMYMGANSSWEIIYTLVAAVICIWTLWIGNRQEHDAYKKLKK